MEVLLRPLKLNMPHHATPCLPAPSDPTRQPRHCQNPAAPKTPGRPPTLRMRSMSHDFHKGQTRGVLVLNFCLHCLRHSRARSVWQFLHAVGTRRTLPPCYLFAPQSDESRHARVRSLSLSSRKFVWLVGKHVRVLLEVYSVQTYRHW